MSLMLKADSQNFSASHISEQIQADFLNDINTENSLSFYQLIINRKFNCFINVLRLRLFED
jgi:hypothetical protein